MTVKCIYCHEEIDSDAPSTRARVWGWERRRRQGGTNHLELRQTTGEHACGRCITLLISGVNPGQLELTMRRVARGART